ncbi:hypothetical protein [Enterococcus sp. AZ163]|uniref:hypothetical protein n=1 Tax=Enterococcus sp. AZ163 TaxID=2774638 RepID=UPI003D29B5BD
MSVLSFPNHSFATEETLAKGEQAKLTASAEFSESGDSIDWYFTYTHTQKVNTEDLSKGIRFQLAYSENLELLGDIIELEKPKDTLTTDSEGWYYLNENAQSTGKNTIYFQTKIMEKKQDYTVMVAPQSTESNQESAGETFQQIGAEATYNFTVSNETATNETVAAITDSSKEKVEEVASDVPEEIGSLARLALPQNMSGDGYGQIPYGAKEISSLFAPVNGAANAIINQRPTNGENDNRPYDLIELSGSSNWLSIWSNESNKLDFNKDFSGRVYIQFDKANSDGLAFVMHNDAKGTAAITSAQSKQDGQNLGVYGQYNGKLGKNKFGNPYGTAIQNSIAVEFDMRSNVNNDAGDDAGNAFDYKLALPAGKEQHMAYLFPGNPNTYQELLLNSGNDGKDNKWSDPYWLSMVARKARLRHYIGDGVEAVQLINGINKGWYEFRFDYEKGKGLNYFLSNPVNGSRTTTVTIPEKDLIANLNLAATNNTAYWGFTAANGAALGTTRFVFTETPVELASDLKNDIKNVEGSSVQVGALDDLGQTYLPNGDSVMFESTYELTESDRDFTLNQWSAQVKPEHIEIPENHEVTINYQVDDEPSSQITGEIDDAGQIVLDSGDLTIEAGHKVKWQVTLPTKKLEEEEAVKSSFYSTVTGHFGANTENQNFDSNSSYFWIKKVNRPPVITNLTTIMSDQTFTDFKDKFGVVFDYADNDAQPEELTYELKINDQSFQTGTLQDPAKEQFKIEEEQVIDLLSGGAFVRGENTLSLTITDSTGLQDIQTLTFQVKGYLGYETMTDSFAWKTSKDKLSGNKKNQTRTSDMQIKGRDTLSDNSQVRITAKASAIQTISGKTIPASDLVFLQDHEALELSEVSLAMNQLYQYSASEGLLLKLSDQSPSGTYSGTITWAITDAP